MTEKIIHFFLLLFNHSLRNELKLIQLGILKGNDALNIKTKFEFNQEKWKTRIDILGERLTFPILIFSPIFIPAGMLIKNIPLFFCYEFIAVGLVWWALSKL